MKLNYFVKLCSSKLLVEFFVSFLKKYLFAQCKLHLCRTGVVLNHILNEVSSTQLVTGQPAYIYMLFDC